MKPKTLLFLRFSIGMLLVFWGIDKLVNIEHALKVSEKFYWNLFSAPTLVRGFGLAETVLGLLIVAGCARRFCYPLLLAIVGFGAVSTWQSIVDPWGWVFEGSNVLFYPSLIILAGSAVLWAFQDEDTFALDHLRARSPAVPRGTAHHA